MCIDAQTKLKSYRKRFCVHGKSTCGNLSPENCLEGDGKSELAKDKVNDSNAVKNGISAVNDVGQNSNNSERLEGRRNLDVEEECNSVCLLDESQDERISTCIDNKGKETCQQNDDTVCKDDDVKEKCMSDYFIFVF